MDPNSPADCIDPAGFADAADQPAACEPSADDQEVSFCVMLEAGPAYVDTIYDDDGSPVRVLAVGGAYQSATYLGKRWHEPVFAYYRAFDRMFEAAEQGLAIDRVLMLGGGGCSYPKHLLMSRPHVGIDVVEPDPGVIDLAYEYFFVDRLEEELEAQAEDGRGQERFRIIEATGREYLDATEACYEVIVNDAFFGSQEAEDLVDDAGLEAVRAHLTRGGLYCINVTCNGSPEDFARLHGLLERLQAHFANACAIDASDDGFASDDNYLVIATDGPYAFSDVIGGF